MCSISTLRDLTVQAIRVSPLDEIAYDSIRNLVNLESLKLLSSPFKSLKGLEDCTKLEYLRISYCRHLSYSEWLLFCLQLVNWYRRLAEFVVLASRLRFFEASGLLLSKLQRQQLPELRPRVHFFWEHWDWNADERTRSYEWKQKYKWIHTIHERIRVMARSGGENRDSHVVQGLWN